MMSEQMAMQRREGNKNRKQDGTEGDFLKDRVLVLGGGGFIGSHVVRMMITDGLQVRIFDQRLNSNCEFPKEAEMVIGDWRDRDALASAAVDCSSAVHLISCSVPASSLSLASEVEDNVLPSVRLLEVLSESGIRRLVFSSSGGAIYGEGGSGALDEDDATAPQSSYGVGKLLVENCLAYYARKAGAAVTILRPSNPYGPGQSPLGRQGAVAIFMGRVARGEEVVLYGDPVRDFVYVEDLARAFVRALCLPAGLQILNVGSGTATRLSQLLQLVEKVVGRKAKVVREETRDFDVGSNVLKVGRAQECLGWSPEIQLEDGIQRTWDWVRKALRQ